MERSQLEPAVFFGPDALAALEGLAGQQVMVITDSFLTWSGLLKRVRARPRGCTVKVFDQVVSDPPLGLVARGAKVLAELRPQTVVTFGGGSPMDRAKAVLEFSKKLGTEADIRFVAVPTTAGVDPEIALFTMLTDRAREVRYPLADDALLPDEATLDPSLLAEVPPTMTANTGMDVLTHIAEACMTHGVTPCTDVPAGRALTLAWQNLRPAWETAGESGAKGNMLLVLNLTGIAFDTAGLDTCHSLAYALGGRSHLPHGRLNTLILSRAIHLSTADETAAEKYGRLAGLRGLTANSRSLAAGLDRLCAQLKPLEHLSACGVEGKKLIIALDGLIGATQAGLYAPSNPHPTAAKDLKNLLGELA